MSKLDTAIWGNAFSATLNIAKRAWLDALIGDLKKALAVGTK